MNTVLMKIVLLCIASLFLMLTACSNPDSSLGNAINTQVPTINTSTEDIMDNETNITDPKQEDSNDEGNIMIITSADPEYDGKYFVPNEAADQLVEIFYGNTMQKVAIFPDSAAAYTFHYGEDFFNIDGSEEGLQVCAKINQQLYLLDLSTEQLAEVYQIIKLILKQ